jgi:hypothetical protein
MNYQTRIPTGVFPDTWIGRVIATLVAAGLAVVGLFFVAFALTAAAVVAAIVVARIWWVSRKLRVQRDKDVIEGSYSIESEHMQAVHVEIPDSGTLPPGPK